MDQLQCANASSDLGFGANCDMQRVELGKGFFNQTGSTRSNQIRPFLIEQIFLPYAMAACQPVSLSTSSFGSPNTTRPSLDEVEVVAVTKIWSMLGSMMP